MDYQRTQNTILPYIYLVSYDLPTNRIEQSGASTRQNKRENIKQENDYIYTEQYPTRIHNQNKADHRKSADVFSVLCIRACEQVPLYIGI